MEFAVLGFLIARPMHGYRLKRALSPALPREELVNDGILYPLLKRLEREKLVRAKSEVEDGRTRKVYHVTAAGRRSFEEKLHGDSLESERITYDFFVGQPFLTKCMFFAQLDPDHARAKFEAQRAAVRIKLRTLQEIRDGMVEREVDSYRIAILDLGIEQTIAKERWLDRMVRRARAAGSRATA